MTEQSTQMSVEKIEEVLLIALKLRHPLFAENYSPRQKVDALTTYIEKTAWHRGELEEAFYWASDAGKVLRRQWDRIEGWEATAGRKATKEQANEAKRLIQPDTWEGIQDAKKLCDDIGRQIRRLELDFQAASRSYSLITGSS